MGETNKRVIFRQRFPLQDVLNDNPDYLISQIASELPQRPPRNGSAVRIKTLLQLCELLRAQNKKLDQLQDLVLNLSEQNHKLNTLRGVVQR